MSRETGITIFLVLILLVVGGALIFILADRGVLDDLQKQIKGDDEEQTETAADVDTGGEGDQAGTETPDPLVTPSPTFAFPTDTPTPDPRLKELPPLTQDQLRDLLPQPEDLPLSFGTDLTPEDYPDNTEEILASLRENWPAGAAAFQRLVDQYQWDTSVGLEYPCLTDRPASDFVFEVIPFKSPEDARAFVNDPTMRDLSTAMYMVVTETDYVHGWYTSTIVPLEGECYTEEMQYNLMFEYFGLLFSINASAGPDTDATIVFDMIDQTVPTIIRRVESVSTGPLAATPIPPPPPDPQTDLLSLDNLPLVMPTIDLLGLPADIYLPIEAANRTYTLDQLVEGTRNIPNREELADTIAQVGTVHGLIGQETRYWDASNVCPQDYAALSVELDIVLFETAEGARGYLNDALLQRAWLDTNDFHTFEGHGSGLLALGSIPEHPCGSVKRIKKTVPYGRTLITYDVTVYSDVKNEDLLEGAIDPVLEWTSGDLATLQIELSETPATPAETATPTG